MSVKLNSRIAMAVIGLALTSVGATSAQAGGPPPGPPTHCYISIGGPSQRCNGFSAPGGWFEDNYQGSGQNSGRCLLRAREYQQYCGMPSFVPVTAAFNVDPVATVTAQTAFGQGFHPPVTYGFGWVALPTQ